MNEKSSLLRDVQARVVNTKGSEWTSRARNLALDIVDTPLVTFLDADDRFTTRGLENLIRAYAFYRSAGYVYGDVFVEKAGELSYISSAEYNRETLRTQNLHAITALIPTKFAKAVRFDESLKGWEDWDYFIQLAKMGVCGKRIPSPVITYDLQAGSNRVNSFTSGAAASVREKHEAFVHGKEILMSCCGGDAQGVDAAMQMVNQMPGVQKDGVTLEFTGNQQASVTFNVNGRSYRAGNNPIEKYINAPLHDVEGLLRLGIFVVVPPLAQTEPIKGDDVSNTPDPNAKGADVAPEAEVSSPVVAVVTDES